MILLLLPRCPVDGDIGSSYGWRRDPITGTRRFHSGIDIPADEGMEIRSMWPGRVTRARRSTRGYGNLVEVESGRIRVRYAHCEDVLVQVGDLVGGGETIATVGETGRATGPHLHLEIWRRRRIDPENVVMACLGP